MADRTHIEWTDATWNPITGCSVVSPGCTNCYAMRLAGGRLRHLPSRAGLTASSKAGPVWTGEVRLNAEWLDQPLRWRRPRKIFVCAHGDLFHPDAPDAWIDRVFAVMALAPQHIFQVLTKRAARMRAYLTDPHTLGRIADAVQPLRRDDRAVGPLPHLDGGERWWPLANVWGLVSVEDQRRANERIPDLLESPFAVRGVSAEPLLGPLNLRSSLRPRQPMQEHDLPDTWAVFDWPAWVPPRVREMAEDFWRKEHGRGPKAWLRDAITQGGPALWSRADIRSLTHAGDPVSGRFVHLWNNIAAVVHADGGYTQGSFRGSGVYMSVVNNGRGLDWVIVGGESGPGARPMHPDWARSLRDQCQAAGVQFFMKQMARKAPRIAGRLLDGRTWDQMPEAAA